MELNMFRNLIRNVFIAGVLFIASGCLLTSSNTTDESGVRVGAGTLRQVEVGRTTEDWLLATLGPPTSRNKVRGELEILGYDHQVVKKSNGSVFLLFAGSSKKVEKSSTYFELSDGVVTRYWTES
jgi:hypothetical protein